jgi:hypothetical protein
MSAEDFAFTLELDPAKDGTWSQNETGRLFEATIRRGREDALSPMQPGMMTLKLGNRDGRYSPDKGVISGLDHFIPVRLYATWTTPAVTNIDDNPSVEVDAFGWGGLSVAGTSPDTAESWVGDTSFQASTTNVGGSGIEKLRRTGARFSVTAGLAYTWAPRAKGPSGKAMKIQILWYNSGGSNFQTDEGAFSFGSGWLQPVITATAPGTAVTAALRIVTNGAQGVFDFWMDASFFAATSTLLPYVDGDQPGCSWTGAAHASTSSRSANPQFLLFQGFVADFGLRQDKLDQTAVLSCIDRMGLWPELPTISVGNILSKGTALILHRLVDRLEGELITNWGLEGLGLTGDLTGWSGVGGAAIVATFMTPGIPGEVFEGDACIRANTDAAQALSGLRYTATADIAATGTYRVSVFARAVATTVAVRLRALRDTTVLATKTVTLTTSWQRIDLDFTLVSLGTNRYIEIVTDVAAAEDFRADDLHCVLKSKAITRLFDAGVAIPPLLNAYREPPGAAISDVLESEPGIMFVRAKTLAEGDPLAFKDRNSRPAQAALTTPSRASFGDGDGLLQFADGLDYILAAADRITDVAVTSRGTPVLGTARVPAWELAPKRTTTTGEKFGARYRQTLLNAAIILKGGVTVNQNNKNYGIGMDMEVTAGAAGSFIAVDGRPYDYPTDQSVVRKENTASTLPVRHELPVQMPLQGTATTDMSNEAQRLLDKYKNRVIRLALPLHQWNDEIEAWQLDLELNDPIVVSAKDEPHSPGFRKRFWVEGIEHQIDGPGGVIHTLLSVEQE